MEQFSKDRLAQVLAVIEAHPETHCQSTWHGRPTKAHPCGTVHCLFGHAQLLLLDEFHRRLSDPWELTVTALHDGKQFLGITNDGVAAWFVSSQRTLADFKRVLAAGRVTDASGNDVFPQSCAT